MESEARNACYKDQILIRVPKVRQKKSSTFLSHLRRFDFFCVNFCRGSALRASPPAKSNLSQRRKVSQSNSLRLCEKGKHIDRLSDLVQSSRLRASSPSALGIGAASFFRRSEAEAEKDIAESPTACRNAQKND